MLAIFAKKKINMSLAKALCSMLAFVPAKVLAKDIKLEVVIQDGKLEVIEAKWPQKVSTSFKKVIVIVLSYNYSGASTITYRVGSFE